MIETTPFFDDFLNYYEKAKTLQYRNEGKIASAFVDDPLMDSVHIYDCVERRQAGFSNALEDIHGKRSPANLARIPQLKTKDKTIIRFLHLIHRFTGSGASFEKDHGYRNSILPKLIDYINSNHDLDMHPDNMVEDCIDLILNHDGPTVTSIGNQPPSLKNGDPDKYRLAQHYYYDNYALDFIKAYNEFLMSNFMERSGPYGIKIAVDFCLKWHKDRGFKQWKFVITAFVMDDAEYFPLDIDPDSHCYFGSNCIRAFRLMFTQPTKRMKKQDWHDVCMEMLVYHTQGQPYSLEDVACDMIRYWTEYLPKNGYNDLAPEKVRNNSILKVDGEYPDDIKERLVKEIGYFKYGQKA